MAQIQPVVFPLNLGTATQLEVNIHSRVDTMGAKVGYYLLGTSGNASSRLANGYFDLSEEDFIAHGNDKQWILSYTAEQIGVTII